MTTKSQEQVIKTVRKPKDEDRATIIFQAHYLDWETGSTTYARWAYDRLVPTGKNYAQFDLRLKPGEEVEITAPGLDIRSCEVLLGHKTIEPKTQDELILAQHKLNSIQVFMDGKLIQELQPDRMMFNQFVGKVTVKATRSNCILHVTAYPA